MPLDGALGSEAALPPAALLARAYGARLELVHVQPEPGVEADDSKLRAWRAREKQRIGARFDEIEAGEPGLDCTRSLLEGDPASCILERAREGPASVIAMASHGRSGFSRWVYGSVSEKVLQAATCPVLVARQAR